MEDSMAKTAVIIGQEGVEALKRAHVLVIGCGGVGSSCVEALARGGVGALTILDRDTVAASNINRQAIAFHSTIGRAKVDVMRDMIRDINPSCVVQTHERFLATDDVASFLDGFRTPDSPDGREWAFDWAIDAIDTISVKLALAAYANETGMPLVASMGGGNKLDPTCLKFADLYDTVNCPLCRIMRKEGRKRGVTHLPVLYSSELPAHTETAPGATRADRSDLGTMSYFPPIMGQMLAGWVIRRILGLEDGAHR